MHARELALEEFQLSPSAGKAISYSSRKWSQGRNIRCAQEWLINSARLYTTQS